MLIKYTKLYDKRNLALDLQRIVYLVAENKRKGDEGLENPMAKTKRIDREKCSDLIVLGLPWKSTEEELRSYFEQFGDLLMVQVHPDLTTSLELM